MIDTEIAVALIASGGGVLGAFAGVIASAKLMTYRMGQLEKKVEKHNTVIERTYKLEEMYAKHKFVQKNTNLFTYIIQLHPLFVKQFLLSTIFVSQKHLFCDKCTNRFGKNVQFMHCIYLSFVLQ